MEMMFTNVNKMYLLLYAKLICKEEIWLKS